MKSKTILQVLVPSKDSIKRWLEVFKNGIRMGSKF